MDIEQQDAPESESSAEQIEQQPAESSEAPEQPEAEAKVPEDNVPFHLHPRFQEVIQQKNQLAEQNKAFERQLAEMQSQIKSLHRPEPAKADPLMERLKGIDPEFAERFGKVHEIDDLKKQLSEFNQWRQESAARETRSNIESQKNEFYTKNNVSQDRREIYEALLVKTAQSNPNLKITDLPQVLAKVHTDLSKMFKDVERTTTANYVQGKKADAAAPVSQPKGKTVNSAKGSEYSKNPMEARAQVIQEILKQTRAAKDI